MSDVDILQRTIGAVDLQESFGIDDVRPASAQVVSCDRGVIVTIRGEMSPRIWRCLRRYIDGILTNADLTAPRLFEGDRDEQ